MFCQRSFRDGHTAGLTSARSLSPLPALANGGGNDNSLSHDVTGSVNAGGHWMKSSWLPSLRLVERIQVTQPSDRGYHSTSGLTNIFLSRVTANAEANRAMRQ